MCLTKYISNIVVASQTSLNNKNLLRIYVGRSDGKVFQHELRLNNTEDTNEVRELLNKLEEERKS